MRRLLSPLRRARTVMGKARERRTGGVFHLGAMQFLELAEEVVLQGGVICIRATGHCMRPFIENGERVVLGPLGHGGPTIGEIVLARTPEGPRLHRLVALGYDTGGLFYETRGDAEPDGTKRIRPSAVCGKVLRVQRPWSRWLSPDLLSFALRRRLKEMLSIVGASGILE